jgi:hypothetical protein
MWLTDTAQIGDEQNKAVIAAEVMIWTYATSGHLDPAGQQVGTIGHNGQQWSIWLDTNWTDASGKNDNSWTYITFKATEPALQAEFDIIALLSAEQLNNLGLEKLYIADIELGTEIMRGSGLLWVKDFTADVEKREGP